MTITQKLEELNRNWRSEGAGPGVRWKVTAHMNFETALGFQKLGPIMTLELTGSYIRA